MTPTELRALAEKASAGPWRECGRDKPNGCPCGQVWSVPGDAPIMIATVGEWGDEYATIEENADGDPMAVIRLHAYGEVKAERGIANARYIAACDPQTIIGLIDRVERAEALIERLADALTDEGPDWSIDGLADLRRDVAMAFSEAECPDWLVEYRTDSGEHE